MAPDRPGSQGIFTALLRYSNAEIAAEIDDEDTEPSPVSCLQAELVDCLALLMGKEEEACCNAKNRCRQVILQLLCNELDELDSAAARSDREREK